MDIFLHVSNFQCDSMQLFNATDPRGRKKKKKTRLLFSTGIIKEDICEFESEKQ